MRDRALTSRPDHFCVQATMHRGGEETLCSVEDSVLVSSIG